MMEKEELDGELVLREEVSHGSDRLLDHPVAETGLETRMLCGTTARSGLLGYTELLPSS